MNMVAQTFPSVKREPAEEKECSLFSAQRMDLAIAAEVLSGTNERAMEILNICGCRSIVPIPGLHFTTANEISKFYNVNEDYIRRILYHWRINLKGFPDDVKRKTWVGDSLWKMPKQQGRYEIRGGIGRYSFYEKGEPDKLMEINTQGNGLVYSVRVVLALAAIMYYGKYITPGSVGSRVFSVLKRSSYCGAAKDRIEHLERMRFAGSVPLDAGEGDGKVKDAARRSDGNNGIPVTPNGDLVLSPEFFAGMIKTAVKEAVSEVMVEFRTPVQRAVAPKANKQRRSGWPAKLRKPPNWDEVLALWQNGEVSGKEAARRTGMSYDSFRNYATGKKTFD